MDYSAGVWGYARYDKPKTVQHRALRSFLGVHRCTSNVVINGDTGWKPPVVRRKVSMIKLLERLVNMPGYRITKKIFNWDWGHKGKTWCWYVKQIMRETNNGDRICDVFSGDVDFNVLVNQIDTELTNIELHRWNSQMEQQSKLRFYRLFKENYSVENYVLNCYDKSCRSFIAQLRAGVLPLHVETGRFTRINIEDRVCNVCGVLEDELHFIFDCTLYTDLRLTFYQSISNFNIMSLSTNEKLKLFMTDKGVFNKFGKFIRNCFYKRSDFMYNSVS